MFLFALFIMDIINNIDLPPRDALKSLKIGNANKIIIGHLNINSIRKKIEGLKYIIDKNVDILLISETKLDDTFPDSQFIIDGFHLPYRKDRDGRGGSLLLYVRDYIPSMKINVNFYSTIEAIVIEINLRKTKWLLIGSYSPHKSMIDSHLNIICMGLDELHQKYENFIIIGDLNSEMSENSMDDFCCIYNLKNLINKPTCFKNPQHPTSIDIILTNKPRSFQNSTVIETGLSDFHRLTATVMKVNFKKQAPKVIHYRNYKYFNNDSFRGDLLLQFYKHGIQNVECDEIEKIILDTLNRHAPLKKRYIRANNVPFMTKEFCKAIMVRSRLRNKYLKLKTNETREDYKKQRNYCVTILRTAKRNYYENLNVNLVTDNKKNWKNVRPFFTEKSQTNTNFTLIEDNEIVSDPKKCAEIMNNFFSEAALNLGIDRELHTDTYNANDPVSIAIEKYKQHPSILKIEQENFHKSKFDFEHITAYNVLEVIQDMDISKSYKKDNIPPKILMVSKDICAILFSSDIIRCIDQGKFPKKTTKC